MFRPSNVEFDSSRGALLRVKEESLGVRNYSAGAISSAERFLYGRFQPCSGNKASSVVTGFFLHRDTPRQEIDIEIVGGRPRFASCQRLLQPWRRRSELRLWVSWRTDSHYAWIDTSASLHSYVIEWDPSMIRWFVDEQIVHERGNWEPTPIPHLPMTLHVNAWPSRSSELAGRLARRSLPATVLIRSISVEKTGASTTNSSEYKPTSAQVTLPLPSLVALSL